MLVSIIIPCKNERFNVQGLLEDISGQTVPFDTEVIRINNVSPVAKARNRGATSAKGDILIFIDCDMRLGNESVLHNLIKPLQEDKSIGSVCPSILLPPNASTFQHRYAREVPHCEVPEVNNITDIALATTACWAIDRKLFNRLGGFNEHIIRGEDSELAVRLISSGQRIVLAPNTWCYHPVPDSMRQLIKINFRNGVGVCSVDTFYPHLNIDIHPKGIVGYSERKTLFERVRRFLLSAFEAVIKGKVLLLLSKIFYASGYFFGTLKYRLSKHAH